MQQTQSLGGARPVAPSKRVARPSPHRFRNILVGAGVLVVAGAATAYFIESHKAKAPAPPPPVPVTEGTVEAKDMPVYLTGIGTVQASNSVAIKSRVDGQITKVGFTEGQEVKAGDPLFEIDPRPYQAALEQTQAQKEKDEAQLAGAQRDLDRYAQLVKPGFQTRQSYEDQQATVGQLKGTVKSDQAQMDAAEVNLGFTEIRAPIDGRTGSRLVDLGNMVQGAAATSLVTITQVKPIFVSFTMPQDSLDQIRQSQKAGQLAVEAYSSDGTTLLSKGQLTLIDNQIDATTGTIHLKAGFTNDDEKLWPGEFVNVRLVLSVKQNALTVPAQTVMQGPDGNYAYVVKPDDTVERRVVQVASVQDGVAVIDKGLSAGEKIVVDGQYRLTDKDKVTTGKPAPVGAPDPAAPPKPSNAPDQATSQAKTLKGG